MVTKNKRWKVVKNSAPPKTPFFLLLFFVSAIAPVFPFLGELINETLQFLVQKGGAHIYFPIGPHPTLVQRGVHVPEMPVPPTPPPEIHL